MQSLAEGRSTRTIEQSDNRTNANRGGGRGARRRELGLVEELLDAGDHAAGGDLLADLCGTQRGEEFGKKGVLCCAGRRYERGLPRPWWWVLLLAARLAVEREVEEEPERLLQEHLVREGNEAVLLRGERGEREKGTREGEEPRGRVRPEGAPALMTTL